MGVLRTSFNILSFRVCTSPHGGPGVSTASLLNALWLNCWFDAVVSLLFDGNIIIVGAVPVGGPIGVADAVVGGPFGVNDTAFDIVHRGAKL